MATESTAGAGPIKQAIGPANKRLAGYCIEAQTAITSFGTSQQMNIDDVRGIYKKIVKTIDQIDIQNEKWAKLMTNCVQGGGTNDSLEKEYVKYTAESKFIENMDTGKKLIIDLEILMNKMDDCGVGSSENSTKLPELTLPNFSGKNTEWGPFWSQFKAAVHERANLRNVDKFNYLKSCLVGRAAEEIAGYPASSDSYSIVIKHLEKRFGDKNTVISNLYSELRQLPPASNHIPSIRKTLTEMERIFRLLGNLGETVNSHAMLMIGESKLPQWLLLKLLELKEKDPKWDLDKMRTHSDRIVSLRETAFQLAKDHDIANNNTTFRPSRSYRGNFDQRYRNQQHRNNQNRNFNPNFRRNLANLNMREQNERDKVHVFTINQGKNNTKYGPQRQFIPKQNANNGHNQNSNQVNRNLNCTFCSSNDHMSSKCEKYKGYDNRTRRLRELKRCEKCLGLNHHTNHCIKKIKCKNCNNDGHYALVCPKMRISVNVINEEPIQNVNVINGEENRKRKSEIDINVIANKVYLMALTAEIRNPNTGKSLEKLIFFDPGATTRFMTEECAKDLELTPGNVNELTIYGFNPNGKDNEVSFKSHRVKFGIKMADGTLQKYLANTVPCITKPINMIKLCKNFEILPEIEGIDQRKPDILMSVNDFWNLFISFKKLRLKTYKYQNWTTNVRKTGKKV